MAWQPFICFSALKLRRLRLAANACRAAGLCGCDRLRRHSRIQRLTWHLSSVLQLPLPRAHRAHLSAPSHPLVSLSPCLSNAELESLTPENSHNPSLFLLPFLLFTLSSPVMPARTPEWPAWPLILVYTLENAESQWTASTHKGSLVSRRSASSNITVVPPLSLTPTLAVSRCFS